MSLDPIDRELERLAAATAGIRPTRGFEARVLEGALPSAPRWDDGVLRFGRAVLVVAALSAVLGTLAGIRSDREEAEVSASTYGMEELDW